MQYIGLIEDEQKTPEKIQGLISNQIEMKQTS
jgi:hypothetical protein